MNKYASSGLIQQSGTTIDTRALTVHGKVLVPPQLEFGGTKVVRSFSYGDSFVLTTFVDPGQWIVESPQPKAVWAEIVRKMDCN